LDLLDNSFSGEVQSWRDISTQEQLCFHEPWTHT